MMSSMIGIIPAAGSGVRARPYSYEIHKGIFSIDGKPNIERLIAIMRDELKIREIVISLGYMGDSIRNFFGTGEDFGVKLHYVENQHLDKGWAWSVLLAKPFAAGRNACIMLSDEFFLEANHAEMLNYPVGECSAVVAVKEVDDPELIKRNFSVELNGDRVVRLVENPVSIPNNILGVASFVISNNVLDLLEAEYDKGRPAVDFVTFIDELIRDGHKVISFPVEGHYINLNDVASLEGANDLAIRARLEKEG